MATKRQGEKCYDKAGLDEPIFTLRAQDKTAPQTVRAWARIASTMGAPSPKVEEALACAEQMEQWQQAHPELVKVPD